MTPQPDTLPAYTDKRLADLATSELWQLLIRNEDRVPRNLIDECAARGDAMLDEIETLLRKAYYWGEDVTAGEWWLPVHAANILGLMQSERAGELLVEYMQRLAAVGDSDRDDWLSGYWPALFLTKPAAPLPRLRALAEDREADINVRMSATDCVLACVENHHPDELDQALAWAASIAFDPDQNLDVRLFVGSTLIDFARPDHREALEHLADSQLSNMRWFGRDEIETAYANGGEKHEWERFADPWKFYAPESIAERQLRWAEEAVREEEDDPLDEPGETHVRPTPKIGRNDPCPCGSGKKYKKCCLLKAS